MCIVIKTPILAALRHTKFRRAGFAKKDKQVPR
jgi:hypothetical protein